MFRSLINLHYYYMPAASTAKKVSTTPRKRRTRKATTTKKVAPLNTTVARPIVSETVKEQPKVQEVVTQQPQIAPLKPNLSFDDYVADFKSRWAIHQFEVKALWIDLVKGYNLVTPIAKQGVTYVKDSYTRAFN